MAYYPRSVAHRQNFYCHTETKKKPYVRVSSLFACENRCHFQSQPLFVVILLMPCPIRKMATLIVVGRKPCQASIIRRIVVNILYSQQKKNEIYIRWFESHLIDSIFFLFIPVFRHTVDLIFVSIKEIYGQCITIYGKQEYENIHHKKRSDQLKQSKFGRNR